MTDPTLFSEEKPRKCHSPGQRRQPVAARLSNREKPRHQRVAEKLRLRKKRVRFVDEIDREQEDQLS